MQIVLISIYYKKPIKRTIFDVRTTKSSVFMSKNLFKAVKKALISLQPKGIEGHALKRITRLTALISGMIDSGSCHLNALGSGIIEDIDDASREAAAKRFVENKYTDYNLHYLPYLTQLLSSAIALLPAGHGLNLVIDGSQMGSSHVALMVSLVYKKRSIPIFWVIKKGKKGHFPTDMHLEIIKKVALILQPIVKTGIPITLLGDGEFDSVDLQALCRDTLKWGYVFRTACDTKLYENGDLFQPKSMLVDENESITFIPDVEFSDKKYPHVHFLYWHDKKLYDDPLFLISSYDDPFDIIYFYKQRFSIETLFKDLKSRGFNLDKNRLKKAKSLFNLIIIAALGYCLLFTLGEKNKDNPLRNKVLRIHKIKKNEISIFSFGIKLLQYLLKFNKAFTFKFTLF